MEGRGGEERGEGRKGKGRRGKERGKGREEEGRRGGEGRRGEDRRGERGGKGRGGEKRGGEGRERGSITSSCSNSTVCTPVKAPAKSHSPGEFEEPDEVAACDCV